MGDRLLPAFHTPTGIPYSDVNLQTGDAHSPSWTSQSAVSEVATIQLEFKDLAWASNNQTYEQVSGRYLSIYVGNGDLLDILLIIVTVIV